MWYIYLVLFPNFNPLNVIQVLEDSGEEREKEENGWNVEERKKGDNGDERWMVDGGEGIDRWTFFLNSKIKNLIESKISRKKNCIQ